MRLAKCNSSWVLGFVDETWWSRLSRPAMHAWSEVGRPLHLVEQSLAKGDTEPKALSCYGLLASWQQAGKESSQAIWLRFLDGRPLSETTIAFLDYSCAKVEALGKSVLAIIWDNASWHESQRLRGWVREHNREVKASGQGVRLLICRLPVKSPWLNPIEPHWVHGKRQVAEADRVLSCQEIEARACAHYGCQLEAHLTIANKAA